MTTEGSVKEILTPAKIREKGLNVWNDTYSTQHDYPKAEIEFANLRLRAKEQGIHNPDIIAELWAGEAWSQYRQDINAKANSNRSWASAKSGLELLTTPKQDHDARSRLLGVAGLCQAYLSNEQDEPAEPLLRQSTDEAQLSEIPARIGEAKNELALLFSARARKETNETRKINYYHEAIPLFEDAARVHEEARNTKPTAGHPYNNLAECYAGVGRFEDAINVADKALEKYNDKRSPHSFSARFRKSLALRGLGRFEEALEIYELHKKLRSEDPKLSEQERTRLIGNEDKNIEATRAQMSRRP